MKAYRITKSKYAQSPDQMLDGIGAYENGGRWNSIGVPAVYLAETLSLAVLELLVHLDETAILHLYAYLEVEIADGYLLEIDEYESGSEREIGDEILLEKGELGLVVPSVVNRAERSIVLNRDHPDFEVLVTPASAVEPFPLDPRLLKLYIDG